MGGGGRELGGRNPPEFWRGFNPSPDFENIFFFNCSHIGHFFNRLKRRNSKK